ncbi:hypothetical protein C2G38_2104870, partial [Gigaspora rosea]
MHFFFFFFYSHAHEVSFFSYFFHLLKRTAAFIHIYVLTFYRFVKKKSFLKKTFL